ncbi:MAG TPA: DUF871 family protein [Candidatus Olsenella pullistercoris]|uniref:DUF871 family protein n=1 Tax=Candidatus Olsenella pullistercoris TaxID=2838712 RepID=A0A9D2JDT5_9ACTN|nr:DUF871 family protein [Candidatus Olsenella pullistercoris]
MRETRLGISIHPERATEEQCDGYLRLAAGLGYRVLFVALIGVRDPREEVVARYARLTTLAHELGFEVCCDVNPGVLARFGVNCSVLRGKLDLRFLREIGADAMRLDTGLSELEEAFLTRNAEGVSVCLNAATTAHDHVGAMLASGGDPARVVGCHNYYPHRYTGLSLDYFLRCSRIWNDHGLRLQAFVSSQEPGARGPWQVDDGLPTLEMHRDLPARVQAAHLALLGCVDDVIFGNCFASEEELAAVARAVAHPAELTVHVEPGLPESERERLRMRLSRRPEVCDHMIRTVESRMVPGEVTPFSCVDIKRGDVLVDNVGYGHYSGEVQIALMPMENSGRTNVVGHVDPAELCLLECLAPGQLFSLRLE